MIRSSQDLHFAVSALRFMMSVIVTASTQILVAGERDHDLVPAALATRGQLILDDDGSVDRGGGRNAELGEDASVRVGAGRWERSNEDPKVRRSSWSDEMGHTPVVAYQGFREQDLVVEVTFRFGQIRNSDRHQCFRIAADNRPTVTGHLVSAWANPNNSFIKTGFLLQHIRKTPEKVVIEDWLLDRQPISMEANRWHTAILEIVGDEVLFRLGDHVAYARSESVRGTKNLVSLTMGTTWHEIQRVRIWKASHNSEWPQRQREVLSRRRAFQASQR